MKFNIKNMMFGAMIMTMILGIVGLGAAVTRITDSGISISGTVQTTQAVCTVAVDGTGDYTDIQSCIDKVGFGTVFVKNGTYTITSTIYIGDSTSSYPPYENPYIIRLDMDEGAWIKPSTDINVFHVQGWTEFGDVNIDVSDIVGYTSSLLYVNITHSPVENYYGFWGYPKIDTINALGNVTHGNGTVYHIRLDSGHYGSSAFDEINSISAVGFSKVFYLDFPEDCDTGCFYTGLDVNEVDVFGADYLIYANGNSTLGNQFNRCHFNTVHFQDYRNTTGHGIVAFHNNTGSYTTFDYFVYYDQDPDERVFEFDLENTDNVYANLVALGQDGASSILHPCLNSNCGRNTIIKISDEIEHYGNRTYTYDTPIVMDGNITTDRITVSTGNDLSVDGNLLFVDASDNFVGIGGSNAPTSLLYVYNGETFALTSNPTAGNDNIFLSSLNTAGINKYYGSIAWSKASSGGRYAAIAAKQTDADEDRIGLAFFTHSAPSGASDITESMVLTHEGNLTIDAAMYAADYYIDNTIGYTGTCVNVTYNSGIAVSCND